MATRAHVEASKGPCARGSDYPFAHDADARAPMGKGQGNNNMSASPYRSSSKNSSTKERSAPQVASSAGERRACEFDLQRRSRMATSASTIALSRAVLRLAERQVSQAWRQMSGRAHAGSRCRKLLQQADAARAQPVRKERRRNECRHRAGLGPTHSGQRFRRRWRTESRARRGGGIPRRDRKPTGAPMAGPEAQGLVEHRENTEDHRCSGVPSRRKVGIWKVLSSDALLLDIELGVSEEPEGKAAEACQAVEDEGTGPQQRPAEAGLAPHRRRGLRRPAKLAVFCRLA